MIYDMAIIRIEGTFCGIRLCMDRCSFSHIIVDDVKLFRPIWDKGTHMRITASEFKVYFHYRKEDAGLVKEWREKYDIKKRYDDRSGRKA